jgi:hypothetical protein
LRTGSDVLAAVKLGFLDIEEFNRLMPELLFEKVYDLVIQDVQGGL